MPITRSTNNEGVNNNPKKSSEKKLFVILILLVIIGLGGTGYFYYNYSNLKKNPNAAAEKEVKGVLSKIGKFMVLPTDETPTLATVMDKEKLAAQPFFSKAQNGDKLVVYTKSRKAILFRESTNMIIEVAPIYFDAGNGTTPTAPTTPTTPAN